jgi:hypothetical protein
MASVQRLLIVVFVLILVGLVGVNIFLWLSSAQAEGTEGYSPVSTLISELEARSTEDALVVDMLPGLSTVPPPVIIEPMRIAWFYKPPGDDAQTPILSEYFDVFVLTKGDENLRNNLLAQGASEPILRYLLSNAILEPTLCRDLPWRNQVADQPGDACTIREQHADWFLYTGEGDIVVDETGGLVMNPANPGWRQFFVERVQKNQGELGWKGVFLDNVETSFRKRIRLESLPADYPNDSSYQAAVEDFIRFLYETYFQPAGQPVYANLIEYQDANDWMRFIPYLDGAMMEDFAVGWDSAGLPVATWEMQQEVITQTQALGREVILVAQGSQSDILRQEFALASYLLVNNGRASFRYADTTRYDEVWMFNNYLIQPGQPVGPRYQEGELWRRDFVNGFVIVDPVTQTAELNFQ